MDNETIMMLGKKDIPKILFRKDMNIMENKAVKMCPHCYVPMEEKVANYPMGSALLSVDRFHVDIYCCPQCKLVKLFAAEAEDNLVKCPVCGTMHPKNEKCAICALNTAFDGTHTN